MENEILQKISVEFLDKKDKNFELQLIKTRLNELKKDKLVREYIRLTSKIENEYGDQLLSEQDMIYEIFLKYKSSIKKSNNIYVYMGTYRYIYEFNIERGPKDYRVSRDDINADYSIYMDLETEVCEQIPISERQVFERTNKIIYPKDSYEQKEINEMQHTFIEDCINFGQENAVRRVLSRNQKN